MLLESVEFAHALAQLLDLLLQPLGLRLHTARLGAIGSLQHVKVALNALRNLLLESVDLHLREVPIPVVDCLEFAAIDGNDGLREQLEFTAKDNKPAACVLDAFAAAAPEVCDRLEVRGQPACQPHQLDVALALPLHASTGLDTVEVAVDIDLQQHSRVIRGAARQCRRQAIEAQSLQVKFADECVDHSDRVVLGDEVVKALWQQRNLVPIVTFNKSGHLTASPCRVDASLYGNGHRSGRGFSHSLSLKREVRSDAARLPPLANQRRNPSPGRKVFVGQLVPTP